MASYASTSKATVTALVNPDCVSDPFGTVAAGSMIAALGEMPVCVLTYDDHFVNNKSKLDRQPGQKLSGLLSDMAITQSPSLPFA